MRMLAADRRRYPELYNYIKVQVPKLKRINKVVRALETYGSLTAAETRSALSWGSGPLVVVSIANYLQDNAAAYQRRMDVFLHQGRMKYKFPDSVLISLKTLILHDLTERMQGKKC